MIELVKFFLAMWLLFFILLPIAQLFDSALIQGFAQELGMNSIRSAEIKMDLEYFKFIAKISAIFSLFFVVMSSINFKKALNYLKRRKG